MEFNKAVLGFKQHRDDMAAKAAERRDQAKLRHEEKLEGLRLRGRQLDIQAANNLTQARKPEYIKLANEKSMQQIMYSTAIKNNEFEKADKINETIMDIEEKQSKLLAPLMAMQGSGITGAPGAAPPARGDKTIDFKTGKETR
jgi:hypothetical protein